MRAEPCPTSSTHRCRPDSAGVARSRASPSVMRRAGRRKWEACPGGSSSVRRGPIADDAARAPRFLLAALLGVSDLPHVLHPGEEFFAGPQRGLTRQFHAQFSIENSGNRTLHGRQVRRNRALGDGLAAARGAFRPASGCPEVPHRPQARTLHPFDPGHGGRGTGVSRQAEWGVAEPPDPVLPRLPRHAGRCRETSAANGSSTGRAGPPIFRGGRRRNRSARPGSSCARSIAGGGKRPLSLSRSEPPR